jgi:hypothetical protein
MYIQPTMTEARAAWLERLSHGPAERGRGTVVPFQCMKLGWTEWHYVERGTGLPLTEAEALKRWGRGSWYPHVKVAGERLTPAGWTVLNQWRETERQLEAEQGQQAGQQA